MRISVVIPTHNRAHTLERALASALAQTRKAKEIIVVDDGSSDGTLALLAHSHQDMTVIAQENQGVSAARNVGIKGASGDWIALLDSDDEWMPHKLESQVAALKANPKNRVCHSDEIWIRNGRRVNAMDKHRKTGGWIYQRCLPLCAISPSSALIHRSVFDECGLFDETLPVCEDYDMWLRICSRMPVVYVDEKLIVKYGGHDDQLSKRHWGMDRFRVIALQKILSSNTLSEEDRRATIDMLIRKLKILTNGAEKRCNLEMAAQYREILAQYGQGTLDDISFLGEAA